MITKACDKHEHVRIEWDPIFVGEQCPLCEETARQRAIIDRLRQKRYTPQEIDRLVFAKPQEEGPGQ